MDARVHASDETNVRFPEMVHNILHADCHPSHSAAECVHPLPPSPPLPFPHLQLVVNPLKDSELIVFGGELFNGAKVGAIVQVGWQAGRQARWNEVGRDWRRATRRGWNLELNGEDES